MDYSEWNHVDNIREDLAMFEFSDNLNTIKNKTMASEKSKYNDSQEHILEKYIVNIFKSNLNGIFNEEELENLKVKQPKEICWTWKKLNGTKKFK
jgi:hypothetical protein